MPTPALITLLTDFGISDVYAGIMKGVIYSLAPDVRIVDITHAVPPQDIASGAWLLQASHPFFPPGTIHVAVVDPGVGSSRAAVLVETAQAFFIAPDNGLLSYIMKSQRVIQAIVLTEQRYWRNPVSDTFHGRDIFAPVAAHLAQGVEPLQFGSRIAAEILVCLSLPGAEQVGTSVTGHVVYIDHYGNLVTNIGGDLAQRVLKNPNSCIAVRNHVITRSYRFYAQAPERELFAVSDSSGNLAIALKNSNAAALLGSRRGDLVTVTL